MNGEDDLLEFLLMRGELEIMDRALMAHMRFLHHQAATEGWAVLDELNVAKSLRQRLAGSISG